MRTTNIHITSRFEGLDGLLATLDGLSKDVCTDVIEGMVKEGGKVVQQSIKQFAPKDEGNLKKSISLKVQRKPNKGTAVAVVGPSTQWFNKGRKVGTAVKRKRRVTIVGKKGAARPAWYAHLVEFGHAKKGGGRVAPRPFMRPGTESAKQSAALSMILGFQRGLNKATRRAVRLRNRS